MDSNTYTYTTFGTCARKITFVVEDGIIKQVAFDGGCEGNAHGLVRLLEGMHADEVIKRLKGIDCEGKGTSCPDQLARALEEIMKCK